MPGNRYGARHPIGGWQAHVPAQRELMWQDTSCQPQRTPL